MTRHNRSQHDRGPARTAVLAFVVVLLVVKALWSWIAPAFIEGAVEPGTVEAAISWGSAVKAALVAALIAFVLDRHRRGSHRRNDRLSQAPASAD